jgi:hypothetical protein
MRSWSKNPTEKVAHMDSVNDILFTVAISIDTKGELQFENPIELTLPDNAVESASLLGNGTLTTFVVKIRAANTEEATEASLQFANRVADMLAYRYGVKTQSVAVVSCSYTDGINATVHVRGSAQINAFVSIAAIPEDGAVLSELISRQLPSKGYALLSMYRQSRNEESILARYLLLYRLLEYKFKGAANLDEWIMVQRPNTKQIYDREIKKTIFTDLRDKIHPSATHVQFPYEDIRSRVDDLEELAKMALKESLNDNGVGQP